MSDLYNTLGIDKSATSEEIKKAYQKLAKKNHPDSPERDEDRWEEVSKAYEILNDPGKRRIYDETGIHNSDHDELVASTVAALFIRFFDPSRGGNPITSAVQHIERENAANADKIKLAKVSIVGINSMLKRLSRSDKSAKDPVRDALSRQKADMENLINSTTYVISLMTEVMKELRIYRIEHDTGADFKSAFAQEFGGLTLPGVRRQR
jgi:DnaJ-class molecular chaperone